MASTDPSELGRQAFENMPPFTGELSAWIEGKSIVCTAPNAAEFMRVFPPLLGYFDFGDLAWHLPLPAGVELAQMRDDIQFWHNQIRAHQVFPHIIRSGHSAVFAVHDEPSHTYMVHYPNTATARSAINEVLPTADEMPHSGRRQLPDRWAVALAHRMNGAAFTILMEELQEEPVDESKRDEVQDRDVAGRLALDVMEPLGHEITAHIDGETLIMSFPNDRRMQLICLALGGRPNNGVWYFPVEAGTLIHRFRQRLIDWHERGAYFEIE